MAFFILINAYYGGALTMFFSSKLTLPFISIEDVMRSYPDWSLKFIHGNDLHFIVKAKSGDYLYSEYWERVTKFREQHEFQNLEEGTLWTINDVPGKDPLERSDNTNFAKSISIMILRPDLGLFEKIDFEIEVFALEKQWWNPAD